MLTGQEAGPDSAMQLTGAFRLTDSGWLTATESKELHSLQAGPSSLNLPGSTYFSRSLLFL
ncbi:hypothetical protein [Paenibacillus pabuli]|uniref:hypothetical protein n=1 Tax=Paenibacillus pabuli TaxID=1472 RepID=UPI0012FA14AA|nr:hypothetical protein [Paenibacillus pabuli]